MSNSKQATVVLLVILSLATAGCFADTSGNEDTETPSIQDSTAINYTSNNSGAIQLRVVASPPSNATVVPAKDVRIAAVDTIQQGVQQAVETDATRHKVGLRLSGEQFTKTAGALRKLPRYNGSHPDKGYYIRYNESVVSVILLVEE
ncbi:hypothetical protein [Halocatena halophila]|uniref:hypothetical protein n=1 Tax=Halocatena halophila TaxID=2814576 RepID=UPI002ED4E764